MMRLKTVQANAFKSAFEVLKDILNDVNIYFTKEGMKILTLDTARSALVDFNLHADNFEEYECTEDCVAGINIANAFKTLKTISTNDTLTIEINNRSYMKIIIHNENKKSKTEFELKMLDIDEDHIELPEVEMSVITVLPSVDFQRICRDMSNLAQEMRIERKNNEIIFACEGDFANQSTSTECNNTFDGHLGGLCSLKYLIMFTKATGMCSNVQIMMEKEMKFLVLHYNVANLGEVSSTWLQKPKNTRISVYHLGLS